MGIFPFLDKARTRDSIWTQTQEVCTQRAIKALKSESYSRSLKYCVLLSGLLPFSKKLTLITDP